VATHACKSQPIILISASFDPSAVRVDNHTVYAGRREADVVMTSVSISSLDPPSRNVCDTGFMHKRSSKKSESDENEAAFAAKPRVIALTEGEDASQPPRPGQVLPMRRRKNPAAVALGRRGGLKSAKTRMDKIDPIRRRQIASAAARIRWAKTRGDSDLS
jgi:hypothetical protein